MWIITTTKADGTAYVQRSVHQNVADALFDAAVDSLWDEGFITERISYDAGDRSYTMEHENLDANGAPVYAYVSMREDRPQCRKSRTCDGTDGHPYQCA